jgi:hypothetical protein
LVIEPGILKSITSKSIENLDVILPEGVALKKEKGAPNIEHSKRSCMILDADIPAKAYMKYLKKLAAITNIDVRA